MDIDTGISARSNKEIVTLNKNYEYDGPRRFMPNMTIFEVFSKMKIHKVYYVDEFSLLPQQFMGFVYTVFDRDYIVESVKKVYDQIKRVIINKAVDEDVTFAHFSFIRLFVEFIKFQVRNEIGGLSLLDNLIPDIEEYEKIFQ